MRQEEEDRKTKKKKREREEDMGKEEEEEEEEKMLMIGNECIQVPFHHLPGRIEEKQLDYPYSLP